jgi:hypothetical protein
MLNCSTNSSARGHARSPPAQKTHKDYEAAEHDVCQPWGGDLQRVCHGPAGIGEERTSNTSIAMLERLSRLFSNRMFVSSVQKELKM